MVNPNGQSASVHFVFTGTNGSLENGAMTIQPGTQIAAFLNQVPFGGPDSFEGSFTFDSSLPIAVAAIRGRLNERNEWLMTALPVDDLRTPPASGIVFPQFAEGAGTSLAYSVPRGGAQTLQTPGSAMTVRTGAVYVSPDTNTATPSGLVLHSFRAGGITVTEFAAPAAATATSFRFLVEAGGDFGATGSIRTALAIASVSDAATVTMELHQADGSPMGLAGTTQIPTKGQAALFRREFPGLTSLPTTFTAVLDLSANTPISVAGLRTRLNERGDFIATVMPSATGTTSPSATVFFPHIVNSAAFTTEFILLSGRPGAAASGVLKLLSPSGAAWSLPVQ